MQNAKVQRYLTLKGMTLGM